jgi:hypothetical protein
MAVEVNYQLDFFLSHNSPNFSLDVCDFWVLFRVIEMPAAVEIKPMEVASIIPESNSVNVDHGEYIEVISIQ